MKMSKFTASNGVEIAVGKDFSGDTYLTGKAGGCIVATGNMDGIVALREFFQHERDQELGRWRWPENPDYVVYKATADERVPDARHITVSNESNGESARLFEVAPGGVSGGSSWARNAARAYFAAHPAPKPWHGAKPGEAWVIKYGGEEHAVISDGAYFLWQAGSEQKITDSRITGGRRIWPEGSNDS